MNTVIWWESQIERDYIYLLEIDPDVLSYKSQPFKIFYTSNGSNKKYTPDFFVERKGRKQVIEVKPALKVQAEENLNLFRSITSICQEKGLDFVVVTDEMIRVQPRLNNVKILYKYARESLTGQNYIDCWQYFSNQPPIRLKEAEKDLKAKRITRKTLFRLLYCGVLGTDLMKPIGSESLLFLSKEIPNLEQVNIL